MKKTKIYLYTKEAINLNSESNRLKKKLNNLEDLLDRINSKLKNKNFIEKAPSEIIKENTIKRENVENEIKIIKELLSQLPN